MIYTLRYEPIDADTLLVYRHLPGTKRKEDLLYRVLVKRPEVHGEPWLGCSEPYGVPLIWFYGDTLAITKRRLRRGKNIGIGAEPAMVAILQRAFAILRRGKP